MRLIKSVAIALIVPTLLSAQERKQEEPKPLPEDRVADTYAVYDAALQRPISFGLPLQGAKYYIINSATKASFQSKDCFHPPDEFRDRVKEMQDDLAAQPNAYKLEPRFKLDKPYELVKHGGNPAGELRFAVGIVSFSKDRSLASVVVWSSCGELCGGSQWRVFTRGKNGWEEQPWSHCAAIF